MIYDIVTDVPFESSRDQTVRIFLISAEHFLLLDWRLRDNFSLDEAPPGLFVELFARVLLAEDVTVLALRPANPGSSNSGGAFSK